MTNKVRDLPTEDNVLDAFVETMENPLDFDYNEVEALRVFEEISKIQGANELLRAIMGRDIKLYWLAKDDVERAHIKGGYARVAWIRGIIKNVEKYKELAERKAKREAK